eukprot:2584819-Amphidinium_carterae.1
MLRPVSARESCKLTFATDMAFVMPDCHLFLGAAMHSCAPSAQIRKHLTQPDLQPPPILLASW